MRDAFGSQNVNRFAGIIEIDGIPTRASPEERRQNHSAGRFPRQRRARTIGAARVTSAHASTARGPSRWRRRRCARRCRNAGDRRDIEAGHDRGKPSRASTSSWSTRTAARCFQKAPRNPTSAHGGWLQRLSAPLRALPYRVTISGHTAATKQAGPPGLMGRGNCRPTAPIPFADSGRRRHADRERVHGRGPGRHQPLFPDDPSVAANPSRHDHIDERGVAAAGEFKALSSLVWWFRNSLHSRRGSAEGISEPKPH